MKTGFLSDNEDENGVVFDVTSTVGDTTFGRYQVNDGTTVQEFFEDFLGDKDPNNYVISVNDEQVRGDYILVAGDDVVVTQSKISGGII